MMDYMIAGSVGGLIAIAVYTVLQYLLRPKRPAMFRKATGDEPMAGGQMNMVLEPGPVQMGRRGMIMALEMQGWHRTYLDGLSNAQLRHHYDNLIGKDSHASAQQKEKREPRH